jgi:hypothetical protein
MKKIMGQFNGTLKAPNERHAPPVLVLVATWLPLALRPPRPWSRPYWNAPRPVLLPGRLSLSWQAYPQC